MNRRYPYFPILILVAIFFWQPQNMMAYGPMQMVQYRSVPMHSTSSGMIPVGNSSARLTSASSLSVIPMRSTSSMVVPTVGLEIGDAGWEKPGTWGDPSSDDDGGGGGYDKPGTWEDPYEGDNPDPTPIGEGILTFLLFLSIYGIWKKRKQSISNT